VLLADYLRVENFDHLLGEKKTASALEKTEQLMAQVIEVMAQGLCARREEMARRPIEPSRYFSFGRKNAYLTTWTVVPTGAQL